MKRNWFYLTLSGAIIFLSACGAPEESAQTESTDQEKPQEQTEEQQNTKENKEVETKDDDRELTKPGQVIKEKYHTVELFKIRKLDKK